MHCELRSAERVLFEGEAYMVVAHSQEGEFAIMEGHAPLIAALDDAPLRIKAKESEHTFAVLKGVLRVSEDGVAILAQDAVPKEEIDLESLTRRRDEIKRELSGAENKEHLVDELRALRAQEKIKKGDG